MDYLLGEYLDYLTSNYGQKQEERIEQRGSMLNDGSKSSLTVGSLPTNLSQVSGIFVDYDVKVCALACIESYKKPSERQNLDWQFKYDAGSSDERTACYIGNGILNRSIIIASRGTQDLTDIYTDIQITIGQEDTSNLLQLQTMKIQKLILQYQGQGIEIDNIYLTGHSLGGLEAVYGHYEAKQTDCIVFNIGIPAASKLPHERGMEFDRKIHKIMASPNIVSYVISTDPISRPSIKVIKNTVVISPNPPALTSKQAHSMLFMNQQLKTYVPISQTSPFEGMFS